MISVLPEEIAAHCQLEKDLLARAEEILKLMGKDLYHAFKYEKVQYVPEGYKEPMVSVDVWTSCYGEDDYEEMLIPAEYFSMTDSEIVKAEEEKLRVEALERKRRTEAARKAAAKNRKIREEKRKIEKEKKERELYEKLKQKYEGKLNEN